MVAGLLKTPLTSLPVGREPHSSLRGGTLVCLPAPSCKAPAWLRPEPQAGPAVPHAVPPLQRRRPAFSA